MEIEENLREIKEREVMDRNVYKPMNKRLEHSVNDGKGIKEERYINRDRIED